MPHQGRAGLHRRWSRGCTLHVNDALGSFLLRASEAIHKVPISVCGPKPASSTLQLRRDLSWTRCSAACSKRRRNQPAMTYVRRDALRSMDSAKARFDGVLSGPLAPLRRAPVRDRQPSQTRRRQRIQPKPESDGEIEAQTAPRMHGDRIRLVAKSG